MRAVKVCLLVVALVFAGRSFAGAGTVFAYGIDFAVPNSSCDAYKAAWGTEFNYVVESCDADPLVTGTMVNYRAQWDTSVLTSSEVGTVTATPDTAAPPSPPASAASDPAAAITETGRLSVLLVLVAVFFCWPLRLSAGCSVVTDSLFFSSVLAAMVAVYWAGFTWGKWNKIFKELGRSA